MRKSDSFLIILLGFILFTFIHSSKAASDTLYNSRGFKKNECFQGVFELKCEKKCTALLNPETAFQLAFRVRESSTRMMPYQYGQARFKVLNLNGDEIKILGFQPLFKVEGRKLIFQSNGIPKSLTCK